MVLYDINSFIQQALDVGGPRNWRNHERKTNEEDFHKFVGVHPVTYKVVWDRLVARGLLGDGDKPWHLMMAIRFLRLYEHEHTIKTKFL